MRVPPDQSFTSAEQRASASSGSRRRSARVTLVRRVPNRKVETRRVSPSACRKCRNSRVYSAIEPEMSQSATTGGGLRDAARNSRSMIAAQRAAEAAARIDAGAGAVGREAARRAAVVGHDEPGDLARGPWRSRRRSSARNRALCRISAADMVRRASRSSEGCGGSSRARRVLEQRVGDAGRAGFGLFAACPRAWPAATSSRSAFPGSLCASSRCRTPDRTAACARAS